ncbi:hypothetical protein [Deinococcus sonorensis]|uniref:Uncharacterized protein n=1 Tax=Deinococcus sonorensis TaxID=309891 RepID=A0ABV8YC31_9DEIO
MTTDPSLNDLDVVLPLSRDHLTLTFPVHDWAMLRTLACRGLVMFRTAGTTPYGVVLEVELHAATAGCAPCRSRRSARWTNPRCCSG